MLKIYYNWSEIKNKNGLNYLFSMYFVIYNPFINNNEHNI